MHPLFTSTPHSNDNGVWSTDTSVYLQQIRALRIAGPLARPINATLIPAAFVRADTQVTRPTDANVCRL